jgi:uncharacterized damage-inducible protein DinB
MNRIGFVLALAGLSPVALVCQSAAGHVVSDAYRTEFELNADRIIAAAEDMPADRYGFRPTPAQMSFAEVVIHVLEGNDDIGAVVGDTAAPARSQVTPADAKSVLVARLKRTFEYCRVALGRLTDSMLGDPLPDYGTRAQALFSTINHWSDHYSQMAIYLRLNGVLPPTARKAGMPSSGEHSSEHSSGGCDGRPAGRGAPVTGDGHPGPVGTSQVDTTGCRR